MIRRIFPFLVLLVVSCVSMPYAASPTIETIPSATPTATGITVTPAAPSGESTPTDTPSLSEAVRRNEEKALYRTILESLFIHADIQCVVIKDHTTARFLSQGDEKSVKYIQEHLPEAAPELLTDFFSQNIKSVPLPNSFEVGIPVIPISDQEMKEFFSPEGGSGWEGFYAAYEGAQGIMELSQAGFNAGMDQALVYVGNQSHYLAGIGNLLRMEKRSGVWSIGSMVMVWIS